ncbi:MAG: GspE/PulE family protein [Sarcina sp.]
MVEILVSDIDVKAMNRLTKEVAIKLGVIIVKKDKKTFYSYNVNEEKIIHLRLVFQEEIEINELSEEEIEKLLKGFYITIEDIEEEVSLVIKEAIKNKVSDIHIECYEEYGQIRYRKDGILYLANKINLKLYNKVINKLKVLSSLDISKKIDSQDGKLKFNHDEKSYDIRISVMPTVYGEKAVLRILYKDSNLINLNNLPFSIDQRDTIDKLLALNNGLILVSGPTGSGKSTTLYAFINSYNKESKNISTIEDPVEFNINGIVQSTVNEKIGFTFAKGLKTLLRQDPDVILIGEIRDEETAKIAVRAAITGHKVLGTIHTSSAKEIYYRLIDMGVEPYLLKQCLKGAISQRLLRTLCENCKELVQNNEILKEKIDFEVYRSKGCSQCGNRGYKGRTMICEIENFEKIDFKNLDERKDNKLIKAAKELLRKGKISIEDYLLFKEGESDFEP